MEKILAAQLRTVNNIKNFYENSTTKVGVANQTLEHFEVRLGILDSYWKSFTERHDDLYAFEKELKDHDYITQDLFTATEDNYTSAKARIMARINNLKPAPAGSNTNPPAPRQVALTDAALPPLALPTFSGKQEEWESFKQRFSSFVRNRDSISNVAKLQHLLNAVQGQAASRLKGLDIIESNFQVAWDKLVRRYDNPRIRLFNNLEKLFQLPSVRARNVQDLNDLIDRAEEAVRALRDLNCPVAHYNNWLVHCIVRKLDQNSRESWEVSQEAHVGFSTYADLTNFIERRIQSLEQSRVSVNSNGNKQSASQPSQGTRRVSANATQTAQDSNRSNSCILCKGSHPLYSCQKFNAMSQPERLELCKREQLCLNCLHRNHFVNKCQSRKSCYICNKKHHTKLHDPNVSKPSHSSQGNKPQPASSDNSSGQSESKSEASQTVSANTASVCSTVLLATANILISDTFGNSAMIRALVDPAAERSFITQRAASLLNPTKRKVTISVVGVGAQVASTARAEARLILKSSKDAHFSLAFSPLILNELTRLLPSNKLEICTWPHIQGLELADPQFSQPRKVDCILGADVYSAIILEGLKSGPIGTPVAQRSVFGWLLTGMSSANVVNDSTQVRAFHTFTEPSISDTLVKFWEVEEIPRGKFLTPDEALCEEHFSKTFSRNQEGRFVVRLPFSANPSFIGSRDIATACLIRSERRLQRNTQLADAYRAFMSEYIDLKHMELVPHDQLEKPSFYLPHHAVFRQESNKIRVVFNASQKASNGISLNDMLLAGPKLQVDISVVLSHWRFLKFAFTTDVVKMFRQILIHQDDRDWQRLLWRSEATKPIHHYRAVTVTYGTASAPFLALRVMKQLAIDGAQTHPEAAAHLQHQLYMDDIFSGADTPEEAVHRRQQLIELLSSAGMELGKWASNDPQILEDLTSTSQHEVDVKTDEVVSTLGLKWLPHLDCFTFKVSSSTSNLEVTKRTILSEIARLFDPLGWLAPTVITAKIILQDLWLDKFDWDTPLQGQLRQSWIRFREELTNISLIKIPRWLGAAEKDEWHLHGFADASKRAYAAAIYAVIPGQRASLLMAKTKIAPLKVQTLPRLELSGCTLLVRLAKHLIDNFRHQPQRIDFWTDSKVVLDWLKGHPSKWPTFVANRTSEILTSFPAASWHHVKSADNSADCATRGLTPSQLAGHTLWWQGPSWLTQQDFPGMSNEAETSSATEIQASSAQQGKHDSSNTNSSDAFCLSAFRNISSFSKIIRILAYCVRWRLSIDTSVKDKRSGYLSYQEIQRARLCYYRAVQLGHFSEELTLLSQNKQLSSRHHLVKLNPFVCQQGLLRVGGRLQHAPLSYNETHPIILPGNCLLVKRIVEDTHKVTLHGGVQLMLSELHKSFWILRASRVASGVYQRCITCTRHNARSVTQQMGPLPAVRVTPAKPFHWTGLDYAGPIPVLFSKGRGAKSTKGYIAIFICMVSRAVHIEVVSDLTVEAFLAAFSRFCARRGTPAVMYSDNATTFKGAANELKTMFDESSSFAQQLADQVAFRGVDWKFIPPRAPHFGGLWEAAVRSFKNHYKRIIGDTILTFEESSTLVAKIEACLNTRPLCPISTDASSPKVLTPADLLLASSDVTYAEPLDGNPDPKRCSGRWRLINSLRDSFWIRWKKEVLHHLQQRNKWLKPQQNLNKGDVVLMKDELTPPTKWPLGLITEVHPGADGLVRVVTLKTSTSQFKRPVVKLVKLPTEPELEDWFHQQRTEDLQLATVGGQD